MHVLRRVPGFPLFVLQVAVLVVEWVMRKVIARSLVRAASGLSWHVYYPVCVARRWIEGEALWKPIDFNLGHVPRTEAQRAYARTQGYQSAPCTCKKTTCGGFMWFPPGVDVAEVLKGIESDGPAAPG